MHWSNPSAGPNLPPRHPHNHRRSAPPGLPSPTHPGRAPRRPAVPRCPPHPAAAAASSRRTGQRPHSPWTRPRGSWRCRWVRDDPHYPHTTHIMYNHNAPTENEWCGGTWLSAAALARAARQGRQVHATTLRLHVNWIGPHACAHAPSKGAGALCAMQCLQAHMHEHASRAPDYLLLMSTHVPTHKYIGSCKKLWVLFVFPAGDLPGPVC